MYWPGSPISGDCNSSEIIEIKRLHQGTLGRWIPSAIVECLFVLHIIECLLVEPWISIWSVVGITMDSPVQLHYLGRIEGLILGEASEKNSTIRLSWSYCYCSSYFIDFGKMDKHSNCFIIWSVLPYMGMARSTLSRPIPPRWLVTTSSEMWLGYNQITIMTFEFFLDERQPLPDSHCALQEFEIA